MNDHRVCTESMVSSGPLTHDNHKMDFNVTIKGYTSVMKGGKKSIRNEVDVTVAGTMTADHMSSFIKESMLMAVEKMIHERFGHRPAQADSMN